MRIRLSFLSVALIAASALFLFFSQAAFAQAQGAQEAQLQKTLKEKIPNLPEIKSIQATPIQGIFEVVLEGKQLVYSSADGSYLIQGELIDTLTKANLTQDRLDNLNSIQFSELPLKDAIKIVHGDGQRKMAVFADPNCGFCKRFEHALEAIDNVTIYLMLYPVLGADSISKSRSVLCAKDPAQVWADWMLNAKPIPSKTCADTTVLDRNIAFGRDNGITGTPTLFFENGQRVPGAISGEQVEQLLNATATAKK